METGLFVIIRLYDYRNLFIFFPLSLSRFRRVANIQDVVPYVHILYIITHVRIAHITVVKTGIFMKRSSARSSGEIISHGRCVLNDNLNRTLFARHKRTRPRTHAAPGHRYAFTMRAQHGQLADV